MNNIFYSIQGEGISIGLPAVFVRLSGCNLAEQCPIPCDTKYAWDSGEEKTVKEVIEEIQKFSLFWSDGNPYGRKCGRIIITGGEPLLQLEELWKLVSKLKWLNYQIEIETNGTIKPPVKLLLKVDVWTVSPKFINPISINRILDWIVPRQKLYLKFVINNEKDLSQLSDVITVIEDSKFNALKDHIFLMPQAISVTEQVTRLEMIIEFAKIWGFRVTPRLQILAYGNKRGT